MRPLRTSVLTCLAVLATSALAAPAYFIQADMVRGAAGAMGAVCVPNSVFELGEMIVFRAYVFDGDTGERLSAEQIEAQGLTVTAELDTGEAFEMVYSPHPPGAPEQDFYWVHGWAIPADHPTGMFAWSVVVRDAAGNEVTFAPIGQGVGLPNLTIVPAG